MHTKKAVSATVLGLFLLGTVPFALAQQSATQAQTEQNLKVLEKQIQTFEAKTALKEKAHAAEQKQWNDQYRKVAKQLEEWDHWANRYNITG